MKPGPAGPRSQGTMDILGERLHNHQLTTSSCRTPPDVVAWLGAVQAQDFAAAKWAIGLRLTGSVDADVERAFNDGVILRTHVLRPTWHFVTPADIRWMLTLTAPRVHAVLARYHGRFRLNADVLTRSRRVIERALRSGTPRTRPELAAALGRAGIDAAGTGLAFLIMHAELEQVICSGPRRGKAFTYALMDQRAPRAATLSREEALATLTRRYFASHGPATVHDFAWWSGVTIRDAKRGLDMAASALSHETIGDATYWFVAPAGARSASSGAYLLPNYDEYFIAYKNRQLALGTRRSDRGNRMFDPFTNQLMIDGRLVGSWARTLGKASATIHASPYERLTASASRALAAAAERYGSFMGMRTTLSVKERDRG